MARDHKSAIGQISGSSSIREIFFNRFNEIINMITYNSSRIVVIEITILEFIIAIGFGLLISIINLIMKSEELVL